MLLSHRSIILIVLVGALVNVAVATTAVTGDYFASWTLYDESTRGHTIWSNIFDENKHGPSAGCSLKQLHVIARHGAKTPSVKEADDATKAIHVLAKNKKEHVKEKFVEMAGNWTEKLPPGEYLLEPQGKVEHEFLAQDYFNLLEYFNIDQGNVTFASTNTNRTQSSGLYFKQRFLDLAALSRKDFTAPDGIADAEALLRTYKHCKVYQDEVATNKAALDEYFSFFTKSEAAKKLVSRINDRLSIKPGVGILTADEIVAIYTMYAYEMAAFGSSTLDIVFDEEALRLLDFHDDVGMYWMAGYGYPINSEIACPLTSSVFEMASSSEEAIGIFQFGHQETLLPVYASFDLYRDDQKLMASQADNDSFVDDRQFKASRITPFAANLAFIFLSCKDNDNVVSLFANGQPLSFSGVAKCKTSLTCPVADVRSAYSASTEAATCNLNSLCNGAEITLQRLAIFTSMPIAIFSMVAARTRLFQY